MLTACSIELLKMLNDLRNMMEIPGSDISGIAKDIGIWQDILDGFFGPTNGLNKRFSIESHSQEADEEISFAEAVSIIELALRERAGNLKGCTDLVAPAHVIDDYTEELIRKIRVAI